MIAEEVGVVVHVGLHVEVADGIVILFLLSEDCPEQSGQLLPRIKLQS